MLGGMTEELNCWPALYAAAAAHGGVVTLRDADEHGVAERSFRRRATGDGWTSLGAGAWLVPGCPPFDLTRHHAALQVFRPDGAISHDTALELLGLRRQPAHEPRIHVLVPYDRTGDPPRGVLRHRSRRFAPTDWTQVDGVRATTAARSILDVAASVPRWRVEALLLAARQRKLLAVDDVQGQLDRRPSLRGARKLRDALETVASSDADSILEQRCRQLLAQHRLPVSAGPVVVATAIGRLAIDLVVQPRVAVECDGYAFHSSKDAFERDRVRWQAIKAAGWELVWVTWRKLHETPLTVVGEVRRAIAGEA